jgi:hypothetical protein
LIAAGPVVAALAGAGAVGVAGGIIGALAGFGIPEYEARRYAGRVKHGCILLSVHSDDSHWTKRAEEVLKRTGAEDISSTSESDADFAVSDKPVLRSRVSITEEPRASAAEPRHSEPGGRRIAQTGTTGNSAISADSREANRPESGSL